MRPRELNVLHSIHDFLPRHRAGSEVYAFNLCRALQDRAHITVFCADYEPARTHGTLAWRLYDGVPVVELANNWQVRTFAETYKSSLVGDRIGQILDAVQPDVVHMHSLLNLSFDLPALARARGARVVATLHDYTLVCPSGGQRLHQAEQHVCETIEPDRCARCFRESPFFDQMTFGRCEERYHELRSRGHTVLMVGHDPNVMGGFCDRALLLDGGKIVVTGSAKEVADRYLSLLMHDPADTVELATPA